MIETSGQRHTLNDSGWYELSDNGMTMIFLHLANRGSRVLRAMTALIAVAMFLLVAPEGGQALAGVDERGPLRAQFFAEPDAASTGPVEVPVHLNKPVRPEIIDDFQIRVKWETEARRSPS